MKNSQASHISRKFTIKTENFHHTTSNHNMSHKTTYFATLNHKDASIRSKERFLAINTLNPMQRGYQHLYLPKSLHKNP